MEENNFYDDLNEFREKYPSCYIEAWTPEDFVSVINKDKEIKQEEIDWNEWTDVADRLYDTFDANHGTNWHKVFHIVEGTTCNH